MDPSLEQQAGFGCSLRAIPRHGDAKAQEAPRNTPPAPVMSCWPKFQGTSPCLGLGNVFLWPCFPQKPLLQVLHSLRNSAAGYPSPQPAAGTNPTLLGGAQESLPGSRAPNPSLFPPFPRAGPFPSGQLCSLQQQLSIPGGKGSAIPASSPNNDPTVPCPRAWQSTNEQLPARGVGIWAEGWEQPLIISQSSVFICFSPPQRLLQEFSIPAAPLQTPGLTRTTPNVVYSDFFFFFCTL